MTLYFYRHQLPTMLPFDDPLIKPTVWMVTTDRKTRDLGDGDWRASKY
jgi:hypothetical protein